MRSRPAVSSADPVSGQQTPAYVYDLDEVHRSHAKLREALPAPAGLYYSLKANPHPAIAAALSEDGCGAEVSSPGELQAALEAGVPPGDILYTGPGKQDSAVAEALTSGVLRFSVDSPRGLDQAGRVARACGSVATCLLRVNDSRPAPGQGMTMTGEASAFGADAEWVLAEPGRFASRPGAEVAGFHLYMGSNLLSQDALLAQFAQSARTARRLADACGIDVRILGLGGGFGAPFARRGVLPSFPGLAGRLAGLLDSTFPGWRERQPEVVFESGRYLTATCGTLLCRVLDVKVSHGRPVVVLESGINHLGGLSGMRRLPPIVPDLAGDSQRGGGRPGGAPAEVLREAIVSGPLCTPLDTWSRSATLAARPGDVLRVPNVGAYGVTASVLAFLGHPAPLEVIVSGGRVTHVSRLTVARQTTFIQGE